MQTTLSAPRMPSTAVNGKQRAFDDLQWHARDGDDVLAALNSRHDGLSEAEASARLAVHGPNALPPAPTRHPLARFLAQFHSTLIYALLAAAVAAALLGHGLDAAVIAAVVFVNAIVGFLQEGKAENAPAAIRRLISPHAHVLRDGRRMNVPVADLIPGDVVLLEAGTACRRTCGCCGREGC